MSKVVVFQPAVLRSCYFQVPSDLKIWVGLTDNIYESVLRSR